MTHVRLAYSGPPYALRTGLGPRPGVKPENLPSVLVSFVYLKQWLKNRHDYDVRDWVMDSGAFSAFKSGKHIDLQEFVDVVLELQAVDPTLVEVFGLDVIDSWEDGLRNVEEMWRQGVEAIPTYHKGEPEDVLSYLGETYPKIAVSGTGGVPMHRNEKIRFFSQCISRVWPCKVHGFAVVDAACLRAVPFHSVDSSSWESGPTKWGTWRTMKPTAEGRISVRGSKHNLRDEVDWYLSEEQQARVRWGKQFAQLDAVRPPPGPVDGHGWSEWDRLRA